MVAYRRPEEARMRFVLLVVGATATGALSAAGIQTMFPQTQQTFAAVTALGGNVADFKLGDINPLKAYEDVKRRITSGEPAVSFPTSTPITVGPINMDALRPKFTIDEKAIQRAWASDMNRRVQQDIARARDFQAYGRNPTGWHGIPPH
jgi:hypothetical protein